MTECFDKTIVADESVQFLHVLCLWIFHSAILDPRAEFLAVEVW